MLSLFLGVVWYSAFRLVLWKKREKLEVNRMPYIEKDEDGFYVQIAELVEHERLTIVPGDTESEASKRVYHVGGY